MEKNPKLFNFNEPNRKKFMHANLIIPFPYPAINSPSLYLDKKNVVKNPFYRCFCRYVWPAWPVLNLRTSNSMLPSCSLK